MTSAQEPDAATLMTEVAAEPSLDELMVRIDGWPDEATLRRLVEVARLDRAGWRAAP